MCEKKLLRIIYLLLLTLVLCVVGMNRNVAVADSSVSVNTGGTRQILLGAVITTGKVIQGEWSTSNSSIARIKSQSPTACTVEGVANGTAVIICRYKYYIGGTIISSSWNCSVEVKGGSSGGSGGSSSGYAELSCSETNVNLTVGGPAKTLYFYSSNTSVSSSNNYEVGIDSRKGLPRYIGYDASIDVANGDVAFLGWRTQVRGFRVGSETVGFEIVHGVVRNGIMRYYNTAFGMAYVNITVTCDHQYDYSHPTIKQKGSEVASKIVTYTCKLCGDVLTEETPPKFNRPDFVLPEKTKKIKENAFTGISASTIYIPDTCIEIGACAFKDCMRLKQIRIPANCIIAENAFDGCNEICIFGIAGSPAETYCKNHKKCNFFIEIQ